MWFGHRLLSLDCLAWSPNYASGNKPVFVYTYKTMNSRKIRILLIITALLFIAGITWTIIAVTRNSGEDQQSELIEETTTEEMVVEESTAETTPDTEAESKEITNKTETVKKPYQKPTSYIEYYEVTITSSASASASASSSSNGSSSSSYSESHSE